MAAPSLPYLTQAQLTPRPYNGWNEGLSTIFGSLAAMDIGKGKKKEDADKLQAEKDKDEMKLLAELMKESAKMDHDIKIEEMKGASAKELEELKALKAEALKDKEINALKGLRGAQAKYYGSIPGTKENEGLIEAGKLLTGKDITPEDQSMLSNILFGKEFVPPLRDKQAPLSSGDIGIARNDYEDTNRGRVSPTVSAEKDWNPELNVQGSALSKFIDKSIFGQEKQQPIPYRPGEGPGRTPQSVQGSSRSPALLKMTDKQAKSLQEHINAKALTPKKGEQPKEEQIKVLQNFNSMKSTMEDFHDFISENRIQKGGWAAGELGKLRPASDTRLKFEATGELLARLMAASRSVGEGGKLTDEDINSFKRIVADVGTTRLDPSFAKKNIERIYAKSVSDATRLIKAYKGYGLDVDAFAPDLAIDERKMAMAQAILRKTPENPSIQDVARQEKLDENAATALVLLRAGIRDPNLVNSQWILDDTEKILKAARYRVQGNSAKR
jgi:hypothetical protein